MKTKYTSGNDEGQDYDTLLYPYIYFWLPFPQYFNLATCTKSCNDFKTNVDTGAALTTTVDQLGKPICLNFMFISNSIHGRIHLQWGGCDTCHQPLTRVHDHH